MVKSGASIELIAESKVNFERQIDLLSERTLEAAQKGLVKFMQNAKNLAQMKLKNDKHIKTSRLVNSIMIYTAKGAEEKTYTDKEGNTYPADLYIKLEKNEVALGSNVHYAKWVEFLYDSFLHYAVKHSNPDQMSREIAKELGLKYK